MRWDWHQLTATPAHVRRVWEAYMWAEREAHAEREREAAENADPIRRQRREQAQAAEAQRNIAAAIAAVEAEEAGR